MSLRKVCMCVCDKEFLSVSECGQVCMGVHAYMCMFECECTSVCVCVCVCVSEREREVCVVKCDYRPLPHWSPPSLSCQPLSMPQFCSLEQHTHTHTHTHTCSR